jgi:hypothetical protein
MKNATVSRIKLPVFDEDGGTRMDEGLECAVLPEGVLKLIHSPGLVEGLAAGDEIKLQTPKPGYEIVRRGGNLCIWFYMSDASQHRERAAPELVQDVGALGGVLDGGTQASLVFTVPVQAGFANIAGVFERAIARHPGSVWLYGNVYDPTDGETPLNWWL